MLAGQDDFPSNFVHFSYVGLMLGQRRRRWPNIKTALGECLVGVVSIVLYSGYSYSAECNQTVGLLCILNAYTRVLCMPILKMTVDLNVVDFFNVSN